MNKLVLNPKARNHFKYLPASDDNLPKTEKEQIEFVAQLYEDLVNEGNIIYVKSKAGNYSIKAVKLDDSYYIVVSMKNEFGTYNNIIYQIKNENDVIAISKFIGKNIGQTMKDYKQQILDAKDMMVRKEDSDEIRKTCKDDNQ